jgi:hypothetical protein
LQQALFLCGHIRDLRVNGVDNAPVELACVPVQPLAANFLQCRDYRCREPRIVAVNVTVP